MSDKQKKPCESNLVSQYSMDSWRDMGKKGGFSPRNLKYMRAFASACPDLEIMQEVLARITWYHNHILPVIRHFSHFNLATIKKNLEVLGYGK